MESYRVKATQPFMDEFLKLFDTQEQQKFNIFKEKIKENPYLGDQLRVPFVREFKSSKGKRAYFLVYEEIYLILFVACGNKKNQKTIINRIFERLDEFKEYAYSL